MILLFAQSVQKLQNVLRRNFDVLYFLQGARKIARFEQCCRLLSVLMDESVRLFQKSEGAVAAAIA